MSILDERRELKLNKISFFYREFLIILVLVVLFFSLFGAFNDLIVQQLTRSSVEVLMGNSLKYKLLFAIQLLGFFGLTFVVYKNGIPLKNRLKKLTKKTVTIIIFLSAMFILLPYLVLLIE